MSAAPTLPFDVQRSCLLAMDPDAGQTLASFVSAHLVLRRVSKAFDQLYNPPTPDDGIWPTLLHRYGLGISHDNDHGELLAHENGKQRGLAAVKAIVEHANECQLVFCQPSESTPWLRSSLIRAELRTKTANAIDALIAMYVERGRSSASLGFALASCRSREDALFGNPGIEPMRMGATLAVGPSGAILMTTTACQLRDLFEETAEGTESDALYQHRLVNHPVARNRLAVWPPIETIRVIVPSKPPSVEEAGEDIEAAVEKAPRLSVDARNPGGLTVLDVIDAIVQGCVRRLNLRLIRHSSAQSKELQQLCVDASVSI